MPSAYSLPSRAVPELETNGQTLYYEVHGEGEPLLLVMGLGTDSVAWIPQLKPFSARYRTITFDNRDVGRSSTADGPYEIKDMARDTLGLADGLELDSFHLLGLSMGGAIAQEVALAAPERVRTLTLAVTYPRVGDWGRRQGELWLKRLRHMSREDRVDELMLLTMSEEFFENEDAVSWLRGRILDNPNPQSAEAFGRQLTASRNHDAAERLTSLEIPTHVIGAERDLLVPVWRSQKLAELIPGAKLTVIPGAPHGANLERRDEFNDAVLGFIEEIDRAPGAVSRQAAPPRSPAPPMRNEP
jgi:3-oxoadipate enol-lactonase